jgi:hypothetical protein
MADHFQQLMQHLWQHLNLVMPTAFENEAYTINVDGQTNITIFSSPETHLNIIANIGLLPLKNQEAVLKKLLTLNCFTPIHPATNFKVGVNPKTKKIELWMRESLVSLSPQKLLELFFLSVEMSDYVKKVLVRPAAYKQGGTTPPSFLPGIRR